MRILQIKSDKIWLQIKTDEKYFIQSVKVNSDPTFTKH